mmetsp:Transcript_4940/g.12558  ORF Transcript_4940/g.12558 Transcript_4940/m.12558 type:complete len:222 (-) Transcript_4940:444-1109(-)
MPVDPFPSDVKRPPRGLSRLTWASSSAARLFGVRRRKSAGADSSRASLDSAASRPPDLRRAMSLDDVSRHLSARSSRGTRLEVAITVPECARGGEELLLETEFGELVVPLPWHARPGQRLVVEVPDLAGGASQRSGVRLSPRRRRHSAASLHEAQEAGRRREEAELREAIALSAADAQGEQGLSEDLSLRLAMHLSVGQIPTENGSARLASTGSAESAAPG